MLKLVIQNPRSRRFLRLTSIILGPIIFSGALLATWYFWPRPAVVVNEAAVLRQLSQVMLLPDSVAKVELVTDAKKLAGRFNDYVDQASGNYIITFPAAAKAVLFDVKKQSIIAFEATPSLQPVTLTSIELRNGSSDPGRAAAWAKNLSNDYDIVDINKAAKSDYSRNIVVNLKGEMAAAAAAALAKKLQAENLEALPKGEKASKADLLVIIGL